MSEHKFTNELIKETSPYLLQHAHNPVNWVAWNETSLTKAKHENKPILVSIGYSACHWCHVMEKESFEDEHVAKIMNENFICIKIDREERPDIDQVYMSAVQLMTGHGGWPLNCFALPDGRPIYGGTYFRKDQWINVLINLTDLYTNEPEKVLEYAHQLTQGVKQMEVIPSTAVSHSDTKELLITGFTKWKTEFDKVHGGPDHAPKFPMPNNYLYLLRFGFLSANKEALEHVELTLTKMALGGIYDQIGGGFARYSTDILWKVPHFEKMLYDNAQLVSLYAEAYLQSKNELFKEVVYETIEFIERELLSPEGGFYSALDADSEGEEGKFYVWKEKELKDIITEDYHLFKSYYNINETGYWEHDNYIPLRTINDEDFSVKNNLSITHLKQKVKQWKKLLIKKREERIRPGLDDKILCSWNALMLSGYCDAYNAFKEERFKETAIKTAEFIVKKFKTSTGSLFHNYKDGKATINGFLEDYSFTLEAFLQLYEITFDLKWLAEVKEIINHVNEHFYNEDKGFYFFTSNLDAALITRKIELQDNVIPAANSSIAKSLFKFGNLSGNTNLIERSEIMSTRLVESFGRYPSAYSNWGILLLNQVYPFYEIAVAGNNYLEITKELTSHYIPNKLLAAADEENGLPLLKDRLTKNETLIYVCVNKTCNLPVSKVSEALKQVN